MTSVVPGPGRPVPLWRAPAVEAATQLGLIAAAWAVVGLLRAGDVPGRVMGLTLSVAVVVAAVLLGVAAWLGGDRRARWVAAAVGVHTVVALLLRIAGDGAGPQALVVSVAVLGMVVMLALSVAAPVVDGFRRFGVLAALLVGATVVPGPSALIAAADFVAWSGAGAVGVVLVSTGTTLRRPLLRRVGLAFATLGAANAVRIVDAAPTRSALSSALEIGAVAMLLVAAVPFLRFTVRAIGRQQDASRERAAEVEALVAGMAERDLELRALVAGLSGAARVLTDETVASLDGRRLLVAAGSELDRLHRMLGGGPAGPDETSVGRVVRDLAMVHRANGLDVWVEVDGDPYAAVEPGVLAQVLRNLLADCRRQAPDARVWLRARTRADHVRVEVTDDGPGMCGSTGLATSAELVERHHGTFAIVADERGRTAVIDLPRVAREAATIGA